MKAVLFDIDGTLLRGYGAGTRAMGRAGRAVCGESFTLDGVMIGGGLDPVIYHEAARNMGLTDPLLLHDPFRDRYLAELQAELLAAERRAHLLPGVLSLLAELERRSDVLVGLVTGNYQRAVPIKFEFVGLGLARFVAGGFGDDAPTRPGLVPIALERMRCAVGTTVRMQDTIIVGDTTRDVDCALQNGCRCLGVGTGAHGLEELLSAGAGRVVEDLSDPEPLLSWL
jgi:phosphoglycolate phosphatase-like HAD superfamily hydrolase